MQRLILRHELERVRSDVEAYHLRDEVARHARRQGESLVRERTRELDEAQQEIIARLAVAGEYRDDGTGGHTRRVGRNAALIARELGWAEWDVELIAAAALLHDVGKIGIRDSILLKPGRLTEAEYELMKEHAAIGGRILSGGRSRLLRMAQAIAYSHHERWDGGGYPLGLAGSEIPRAARIVAVADVLDALCHERPYKPAWPVWRALREIERQSGRQFDPQVVDACSRAFGPGRNVLPTDDVPGSWPLGEQAELLLH